jgi:HD-like signal output (HDOD) protein
LVNLDRLLTGATELEPLPASAARLAQLISEPDWDLDEIVDVIQLDQALSGKLLGLSNSALFGAVEPIRTVQQAVSRLGSGTVLSLAVGSSVQQQLRRPLPLYDMNEGDLWRHSVASALAAENASAHCSAPVPPESYASALLHDVGKLVLQRFLDPLEAQRLRQLHVEAQLSWVDAEEELLSINHAQIGSLVARNWRLPECISEAVCQHHSPELVEGRRGRLVASVVSVSNVVARYVCEDGSPEAFVGACRDLCGDLGMSSESLLALAADVAGALDDVLEMYGDERAAA